MHHNAQHFLFAQNIRIHMACVNSFLDMLLTWHFNVLRLSFRHFKRHFERVHSDAGKASALTCEARLRSHHWELGA